MTKLKPQKGMDNRRWFGHWSNEYDRTLGSISYHRDLLDLVVKHCRIKEGQRILDIGCGTGLLTLKLLAKKRGSVVGIDYLKQMLEIFTKKLLRLKLTDRVHLVRMDANALTFERSTFDLAVSTVTLHHLKSKLPALKKIAGILKPGGLFILGEVDMDTTGDHADIGRLKRLLKVLEEEWIWALKDAGVQAFSKLYDNGKKHILNQGEYCLSLEQWSGLCRKAGFQSVSIKRVAGHRAFGIVIAQKD